MAVPEITGLDDLVEVGRGGFGVVFRARQVRLDRYVAVKLLTTQLLDDRSQRRFEREGRALGTLSGHPNVVALYEFGITSDSIPYLVLEYLAGGSYADRIERTGPLPVDEATRIVIQVAGALESAHRLGIVHCDLKPENVLLGILNEPKLGDFGIAQVQGAGTATSSVLASPAHAAPEIIDGKPATPRSDIYGLGSTLYALLAGRPAFVQPDDSSMFAVLARIASQSPPDLRPTGLPEPVWSVLYWSMAKDPDQRPVSALAFAQQLDAARVAVGLSSVPVPVRDDPTDPPSGSKAVGPTMARAPQPIAPLPATPPIPATVVTPPPIAPGPSPTIVPSPSSAAPTPTPVGAPPAERRSRTALVALIAVFVALIVLGGLVVFVRNRSSSVADVPSTSTPAATTPVVTVGSAPPSIVSTTTSPSTTSPPATAAPATTEVVASNGTPQGVPASVDGYRANQSQQSTMLRVFQTESGGQLVDQFPSGMNHCAASFWTLRWRSESPSVTVQGFLTGGSVTAEVGGASTGPTPVAAAVGTIPDASTGGYMSGTFCEQPAFVFGTSTDGSNLIDLTIDYQNWEAAP
jgi:serine/threonine protein kinase